MRKNRCAIGLGGNLGDAVATLISAAHTISAHPSCQFVCASQLYRSAAIGPVGQPDYANAVLLVDTDLDAWALLDFLQHIEQEAGRVREIRWGARTLDLDILLIDQKQICDARLVVPHAEMWHRAFVLRPLFDVQTACAWPRHLDILAKLEDPMIRSHVISTWNDPRWESSCADLLLHSRKHS